ncbi:MAG TPA: recombination mediator RecR [Aliidongia sp.]|nr:recombination mediator RecR [Aliidongia sp.]
MSGAEIDRLIQLLAKLPGLGPRSARRAVLYMLKRRDAFMLPLGAAIGEVADAILPCRICGNLDTTDPCPICADAGRDGGLVCVIEDVADLWAIERTSSYTGKYHVLGGILSALDGVRPEDLNIPRLIERAAAGDVREVILAMNATVEGQSTAHYLTDRLAPTGVKVSRLAHGVPIGGELDYLDEGTLAAALKARRPF